MEEDEQQMQDFDDVIEVHQPYKASPEVTFALEKLQIISRSAIKSAQEMKAKKEVQPAPGDARASAPAQIETADADAIENSPTMTLLKASGVALALAHDKIDLLKAAMNLNSMFQAQTKKHAELSAVEESTTPVDELEKKKTAETSAAGSSTSKPSSSQYRGASGLFKSGAPSSLLKKTYQHRDVLPPDTPPPAGTGKFVDPPATVADQPVADPGAAVETGDDSSESDAEAQPLIFTFAETFGLPTGAFDKLPTNTNKHKPWVKG